jgi:uncharacterized protein YqfB (UPF0267 family)
MKMNVTNKQERFELGDIIELRGNFTEIIREEDVGYECDVYRTTDKTMTFDKMHKMAMAEQAQKNLDESDKFVAKCCDRGLVFADKYPELYVQREEWREVIRSTQ